MALTFFPFYRINLEMTLVLPHLIVYNGYINHIFHLINLTIFLQAFAQLLHAPHDDAQIIIRERFPVPRLVVCDQHGSQVIFLIWSFLQYAWKFHTRKSQRLFGCFFLINLFSYRLLFFIYHLLFYAFTFILYIFLKS